MTTIIWGIFAFLALLWTGSAALLAQLIKWSVPGLAAAMPAWLIPFVDPAVWIAIQQTVTGIVASLSTVMPFLGEVAAWLVPAVWVTWGLGLLSLLTLALASTWMVYRSRLPVDHLKAAHLRALWRAVRR